MQHPRKSEFSQWGETAFRELRGPVLTRLRKKLAQWRDPRARLLRRRQRAKAATTGSAVATGAFGGGAVVSFAPYTVGVSSSGPTETLLDGASFGLAGLAVATGVLTVRAGMKYRRLKRTPLPAPQPEPVELPPSESQAREPMRRLRDAEQSLHGALAQLSGATLAGDPAAETRTTADQAAAALRQVADRLCAVEATIPHTPAADQEVLRADVRRLRAELDDGVQRYGGLVAAASRAVAAAPGTEQQDLLQDATDRLAGLAAALQELSGSQDPPQSGRV